MWQKPHVYKTEVEKETSNFNFHLFVNIIGWQIFSFMWFGMESKTSRSKKLYIINSQIQLRFIQKSPKIKQEKSKFPTVMKIDRVLGDNIGKK
jgi:hypothetical protein